MGQHAFYTWVVEIELQLLTYLARYFLSGKCIKTTWLAPQKLTLELLTVHLVRKVQVTMSMLIRKHSFEKYIPLLILMLSIDNSLHHLIII